MDRMDRMDRIPTFSTERMPVAAVDDDPHAMLELARDMLAREVGGAA